MSHRLETPPIIGLPNLVVEPAFSQGTPELTKEPSKRALFLIKEQLKQQQDCDGFYKKIESPHDELTGMPLPVLPPEEVPSFKDPTSANWHHHYHPGKDKLLTSINGLALRHVRVQILPIDTHNDYHSIFEGPPLPTTNEQRFGQIVLACAGYVPSHAIDVYGDDPTEKVELGAKNRNRLQTTGELEVRGQVNLAAFMKNYLIRQDFSHVKESIIDEFIESRDNDRRWFLGHWLLAIASEIAVEPLEPVYKQALDEGLIDKTQKKLPTIVKEHVNGRKISLKTIRALRRHLARQSQ
ncbi:hypothetical protein H0X09_03240 [Candidatus Saccharibacteria bacterium]|nr:hypothetical protein [Candidatus Saccharibacteria bacterium]